MPAVTIRNLSNQTHQALKIRAAQNHRSTEAEIRSILDAAAAKPEKGLGTMLYELGQKYGGIELDVERDKSPIEPAVFD